MKNIKTNSGFTLIEFLLYIGLAGLMVGSIATLSSVVMKSRVKAHIIREVEQQGNFVMDKMILAAQNSVAVNTPATGSASTSLALNTYNSSENPTIFEIQNGIVQIKRGAMPSVALTNSHVAVSNLTFQNSNATTSSNLKIEFMLTYRTNSHTREFNYSKRFYGGTTLRK